MTNPEDFEKLSVSEKLLLVQDLWDSIAAHPEELKVTDAQRKELDMRLASHETGQNETSSWEEARKRIQSSR